MFGAGDDVILHHLLRLGENSALFRRMAVPRDLGVVRDLKEPHNTQSVNPPTGRFDAGGCMCYDQLNRSAADPARYSAPMRVTWVSVHLGLATQHDNHNQGVFGSMGSRSLCRAGRRRAYGLMSEARLGFSVVSNLTIVRKETLKWHP